MAATNILFGSGGGALASVGSAADFTSTGSGGGQLGAANFSGGHALAEKQAELLARARELLQAGALDEARAVAARILTKAPHSANAMHIMGLAAAAAGNLRSALDWQKKAISYNSGNAQLYFDCARTYLALDRRDDAIGCCEQAIALDAGHAGARQLFETLTGG
jgi:tetratricopeptide (TPR) repeat protein